MNIKLTAFDRAAIGEIFSNAKMETGIIERLFATPESFVDQQGKVQFRFPLWMGSVCEYLQRNYTKAETLSLVLQFMAECIHKGRYQLIPNFQSEISYTEVDDSTYLPHRKAC